MINSMLIISVSILLLFFVVLRLILKLIIICLAVFILILTFGIFGFQDEKTEEINKTSKDIEVLANMQTDSSKDSKIGE